ncbi:hypothetical protein [Streptomyces sp. NBC_01500]|uniref:hypothetical protein n=1 Tax=Streptomyces sp. NBC_01500 TaxID=2903886 RepID=UPI0022541672|nr:hypothetical protein [Streptomyces sp. NBC_01500]MCX4547289.1 hypothetical protein [Streptomyces sp. NBC_01500]MCX4554549.1 hypothetical protein [Streptomyces sp. NBC_01500]
MSHKLLPKLHIPPDTIADMRRLIGTALIAVALSVTVGCSSNDSQPAKAAPKTSAPTFDRNAALHESWQSAVDTYPADLKLDICKAADKGGKGSVKALLTDNDQMPFVVEHPDYDAGQWVTYCAAK